MERTEITEVTGVTIWNADTGEEIDLMPADDDTRTDEVITVAWDNEGVLRFGA